MKCLNQFCEAEEIETDDNFCYKCGQWTAKGYSFLKQKEGLDLVVNGKAAKKDSRFSFLMVITMITMITFVLMCTIRGNDLFKPIYYLKRQLDSYIYGYNTTIMNTNNIYNKQVINNLDDAKKIIEQDFFRQEWKCTYSQDNYLIESEIESNYLIPNVSLCDVSQEESLKIKSVIDKMYTIFPNIKGTLTNITVTNAETNSEYIARFQPMFQFVNPNENINEYNKVNKTQILLNSYYFLNSNILNKSLESVVGENWYVKDATWESTIAHELGHYISFVIYLNQNNLNDIIFVTKENEEEINNLVNEFSKGIFSLDILKEALNNYNIKYNANLDIDTFVGTISKYARIKDESDKLIAEEALAEAIHDYYLHGNKSALSSLEIVNVIKTKLGD